MSSPLFNPLFSAWMGRPQVDIESVLLSASSGVPRRSCRYVSARTSTYVVGWKPVHVSARLAFERVEQRYAEMPSGVVDHTEAFLTELVGEFRSELLGYITARRMAAENAHRLKGGGSHQMG